MPAAGAGSPGRAHAQSESLLLLLLLPLLLLCRRFFDFLCFVSLLLRFSLRSFFDFLEDLCFLSLLLLLCLRFFSLRAFFLQQRGPEGSTTAEEVRQHRLRRQAQAATHGCYHNQPARTTRSLACSPQKAPCPKHTYSTQPRCPPGALLVAAV